MKYGEIIDVSEKKVEWAVLLKKMVLSGLLGGWISLDILSKGYVLKIVYVENVLCFLICICCWRYWTQVLSSCYVYQ